MEYLPSSHGVQVFAPVADHLPAPHFWHALPFENVPTSQLSQLPAPAPYDHLPLSQLMHTDARLLEALPVVHVVQLTDSPSLYLPAVHAVHSVALMASAVWSPAPQSKHASFCAVGAYFPAGHSIHVEA
eukprot:CAMPEP_0119522116 /NCGR_PEP_ID=MMETSP1344-20130328/37602_1 /TAXON_ID=236787 /ORGANISM="Florenciella parvula, Strain CCMP2471" /LENGTH=128 /DNA_ID=CAMNT_0007560139 /DNA_START=273 /DNA_END=656 /DNA_ORIENTATION=-